MFLSLVLLGLRGSEICKARTSLLIVFFLCKVSITILFSRLVVSLNFIHGSSEMVNFGLLCSNLKSEDKATL